MSEWWTYQLEDFLLFSPRVYWRMFELHNAAVWPLQIAALVLGAAILLWTVRPKPWSDRVIWVAVGAAWIFVGWAFLWSRYATINWAAAYAIPVFAAEGLLLAWFGGWRGGIQGSSRSAIARVAGLCIFIYALAIHPIVATLAGRPFAAAEIFAIAPDPTAIATLGLLLTRSGGAVTCLMAVPLGWCMVSWATLRAMEASEAWVPLTAAGLTIAAGLVPIGAKSRSIA
jgi:hypothetical protein